MTRWLSKAAYDPRAALDLWAADRTAPLVVGRRWDLVRVDFTRATSAISRLKVRGDHIGPYLMGGMEHAMWWPVPLGTGYRVAGSDGVTLCAAGEEILAPPPGRYLGDRVWVLPGHDDERGRALTLADELHDALGAQHPQAVDAASNPSGH